MRKNIVTIAGEDSGGLSIDGHIPEKDGILANLLVLEAMAYDNKTLVELQKDLKEFVSGLIFENEEDCQDVHHWREFFVTPSTNLKHDIAEHTESNTFRDT